MKYLKKLSKLDAKKTYLATTIARTGRFRVRPVSEALKVSRSNLMEQLAMKTGKKQQRVQEESNVLEAILGVVDKQMTYGYRRVHAVVNQRRMAEGLSPINHKRVYRLMKEHHYFQSMVG